MKATLSVLVIAAACVAFAENRSIRTFKSGPDEFKEFTAPGITNVTRVPYAIGITKTNEEFRVQLDAGWSIPMQRVGITNMIKFLVESGEFCRVRGHTWGNHIHTTMEYVSGKVGCRQCSACGLHQNEFSEWR